MALASEGAAVLVNDLGGSAAGEDSDQTLPAASVSPFECLLGSG